MSRVVLLGPQKGSPTAGATLRELDVTGPVATVTAGWQEWEADDAALQADLGGAAVNLRLYERAERVWSADPELRAGHGALHAELRFLRRLYNRRLATLADEWIRLLGESGPERVVGPERESVLAEIQALDRHHQGRYVALHSAYEREFRPRARPEVAQEREDIEKALAGVEAVVVEGGHVAVLVNRIRLFGLAELLKNRTVVACSGGAMALAERVVLFHDSPPWGPGNTEVAMPGIGLHTGVVPLPHASERLRLDDPARVRRLAVRFSPSVCAPLEPGHRLDWNGTSWVPRHASRLAETGLVEAWDVAA